MAVERPDIDSEYKFTPYEIYSPRQNSTSRIRQFNLSPQLRPLQGHYYKLLLLLQDYLKKLGY